jgi:hexosaminidase
MVALYTSSREMRPRDPWSRFEQSHVKYGYMLTAAAAMLAFAPTGLNLIPYPKSVQLQSGTTQLTGATTIDAASDLRSVAELLRNKLTPSTGYNFDLRKNGNSIRLRLDKSLSNLGPEGYRLKVDNSGVDIASSNRAGVFYGTQTLLQLLPPQIFRKSRVDGVRWTLPNVTIEDSPRFTWRGSLVDVSRHFMPKEAILKYLDLLAFHKLNVFHWHLTDDMGWRVEIKQYPRLTETANTDFSEMNPSGATRSINQKPGGFYTHDDVREIVRYAADRNITVVPEIEMPGHAYGAIKAYPELGNNVQIADAGGDTKFNGMDNVYNAEDSTIQTIKNILDEVLELFPSKFIHIGGDEVWKEPWKKNPKAQAKMKTLGLKNEEELQSWFIRQFDDYLVKKGRRLIGWDEILEGGLAPNAAVMSWRGFEGGIAAAKAGHDVVMAPTSHTYLDYYQSRNRALEPKAIGGFVPLETVYSFEPVPPSLTPEEAKHILGAQGQLWAEFIPHPRHLEYMAYPRLTALAEVTWSPKEARNWENFKKRLETHLQRLSILDVNYRPLDPPGPEAAGSWKSGEIGEQLITRDYDVTGKINKSGPWQAVFSYTGGACRLDIKRVDLLENGQVISTDEHDGFTGGEERANTYTVDLKDFKPGAKYVLRCQVRAEGGTYSNGNIYLLPARSPDWF